MGKGVVCLWMFVFIIAFAYGFRESGYIVTSPSIFRSNVDHVINVRIFNHAATVRVNAQLLDLREDLIVSVSAEITNSGNLTVKVPPGVEGGATLRVCGNCHLSGGFQFLNTTRVTLINKGFSAFLQTDKPIYKPGQTVFLNVFLLNRDLKPVYENITIYVVASNDARIIQWNNLSPACCGVINVSFPLSDQPVLGTWTAYVEIDRNLYNSTFEIQKYVLPKFEVSIDPPPFFRNNCEEIIIEAMYVFGKPVVGRLEVNMSVEGVGYFRNYFLDIGAPVLREMEINQRAVIPICLSHILPEDLNPHFRGYLHIYAKVISETGSEFVAFDDSTPVSKIKAQIEFTSDTRKNFKSGISFNGKIVATYLDGSRASNVLILLKVMANRNNFFHQEISSDEQGLISFSVPAVNDNTWLITIKAKILNVNNEPVGLHTSTILITLNNWYSPSNCFIVADVPEENLEVENQVQIGIKSSCPCNFTLFYEIISRGNIVQTGSKLAIPEPSQNLTTGELSSQADQDNTVELSSNEDVTTTSICKTSFSIEVTANMAPTSRLLVYYVRDDGEGIADSISLNVKPKLKNEVRIVPSQAETSPGDSIQFHIQTDPGSCVCLAVVDRSVHIMKPGYRLSMAQIFEELTTYDLDNTPYHDLWSSAYRSKRSGGRWGSPESSDAKYAFLESGLVVMTNVVSLNYKPTTQVFDHLMYQSMKQSLRNQVDQTDNIPMNKVSKRKRTFFPETWIWNCFNTSSGQDTFSIKVPDSVTTWRADAISMNSESGIGMSNSTMLRSSKNFFVDFSLPYSAIRGEVVQIPVTTYNYLETCVEANLTIILPDGVSFEDSDVSNLTRSLCVQAHTTKTINLRLRFDQLRYKNLTALAQALHPSSLCCGSASNILSRVISNDEIVRNILVEAEGMKRRYAHSVYFCPNERINISTSASRSFQFVRLPTDHSNQFDFLVKAARNVRIILSDEERVSNQSFEIVLGGENNQQCWISKGSRKLLQAHIGTVLSVDAFRPFWISWVNGIIEVGTGSNPSLESRFMLVQQTDRYLSGINFVGFATSDGADGEFRLWQREVDGYSEQFITLSLPANFVPHSAKATASLIGDVMGPTLKNLNNLLSLPFGCGEQNLANFAPNIYVLKYLSGTQQMTEQIRLETIRYLQMGYQRQLTYKRHDGSYSAFGNRDYNGSMWLTSFVLKSFSQAREFIYIHPKELQDAKEWIVSWQDKIGAFPPVGKIWNKDIQTGVDGDVALTAYVTVALIEAGFEREEEKIAVLKAREYLEAKIDNISDPYTASLIAYSLSMLQSDVAEIARNKLYEEAKGDDTVTYWSLREGDAMNDDVAAALGFFIGDSWKQTVASAEVEMTGYALLTFTHTKNQSVALPIVKWLSRKRNAMGGFSSTQDTCVALQALSEYAIFSYIGGVNLRVMLDCTTSCSNEFFLNNENDKVLQTAPIEVPNEVFVNAYGVGCALLQVDVTYNIPTFDDEPSFDIKVDFNEVEQEGEVHRQKRQSVDTIIINEFAPRNTKYEMKACVRWLGDGSSNMAVLEANLLTGFDVDLESLERLLEENTINLKRYEVSGQVIFFYFDEVYSTCMTCVRFLATKTFDTSVAKPRTVKIYDYYEPTYMSEITYGELESDYLSNNVNQTSLSQESTATNSFENEFYECRCRHDCGFSGPSVCGNNSILYLNQCRMTSAACESNTHIEIRDKEFCQGPGYQLPNPEDIFGEGFADLNFISEDSLSNDTSEENEELFPQNQFSDETHEEIIIHPSLSMFGDSESNLPSEP